MKSCKLFVSFSTVLITIAVLAGISLSCSSNQKQDALYKIQKAKTLVIGTSADYPPYEFHSLKDGKDLIVGFDIAIAQEIAKDLGVKLEIKDMQFDGLLAALQAGTIDIVISGMTPTEERKKSVDFSTTYYYAVHGVIVRAEDKEKYQTVEALKNARLSAQKGTIQVGIAKTQILGLSEAEAEKPSDKVKELGTIKNLILDLKNKKVDAIVAELPVATAYVNNNPDLALAAPTFTDDQGGSAIAVKKGNPELLAAINKTVERLMAEKKIDQFVTEANELVEN
ncbi:ABC transporter substrate-binding protein [Gracilinema caldarium]|uniref:ABC-type transporter, periplasmic subunit family 3 n=1 Tax=Gracilinema caldarium (strain ATCC 51460 / DSM 7334 / H1) TaxID=744872 RepID=F8F4G4_GRAC1|nr:ABC transporter substrate-binding protein [Gracilinema caldarium]AEJ20611.1 ABC-type transporter, periplasmic subunit family 3 [Gracilinema caldarium DSM 7334]